MSVNVLDLFSDRFIKTYNTSSTILVYLFEQMECLPDYYKHNRFDKWVFFKNFIYIIKANIKQNLL